MSAAERITGEDGVFLRFECDDTTAHTLKVAVLDPAQHGSQITLADLFRVLPDHLHLSRRSTQRIGRLRGKRAWAWVEDEDFDLANHLDEITAAAPGDRVALDQVCSEVMAQHLDRKHPLWTMTLVHGLEQGRQAVIVRIHHAIADGMASINLLHAATSETRGAARLVPRPAAIVDPGDGSGRFAALRASGRENRRRLRSFGPRKDIPTLSRRTPFNPRVGPERRCVSTEVDFADLQEIARTAGVTINGAFHGVASGAMRRDLLDRGLPTHRKLVAAFGIADSRDPGRRHGNSFATSFAHLFADIEDPLERLRAAAENANRAIELRRAVGYEHYRAGVEFQQHILPPLRVAFGQRAPVVGNQITLANVPGPTAHRWIGDIEVIDWISYSIAFSPSLVSLTGYSYAGRLSLGLTVAPEAVSSPERFLEHFRDSLAELLLAVRTQELQPQQGN